MKALATNIKATGFGCGRWTAFVFILVLVCQGQELLQKIEELPINMAQMKSTTIGSSPVIIGGVVHDSRIQFVDVNTYAPSQSLFPSHIYSAAFDRVNNKIYAAVEWGWETVYVIDPPFTSLARVVVTIPNVGFTNLQAINNSLYCGSYYQVFLVDLTTGSYQVYAGTGGSGNSGDGGLALNANFEIQDMQIGESQRILYLLTSSQTVRKIHGNGTVTTVIGNTNQECEFCQRPINCRTSAHSIAFIRDHLYILGEKIWKYNPKTDLMCSITKYVDLNVDNSHLMWWWSYYTRIFGGKDEMIFSLHSRMLSMNIDTEKVRVLGHASCTNMLALSSDAIFCYGGPNVLLNFTARKDREYWIDMPHEVVDFAVCSVNSLLVISGGIFENGTTSSFIQVFNSTSKTWNFYSMSFPRSSHTCILIPNQNFVLAGGGSAVAEVFTLDFTSEIILMPRSRTIVSIITFKNSLVFCGSGGWIDFYDLTSHEWTSRETDVMIDAALHIESIKLLSFGGRNGAMQFYWYSDQLNFWESVILNTEANWDWQHIFCGRNVLQMFLIANQPTKMLLFSGCKTAYYDPLSRNFEIVRGDHGGSSHMLEKNGLLTTVDSNFRAISGTFRLSQVRTHAPKIAFVDKFLAILPTPYHSDRVFVQRNQSWTSFEMPAALIPVNIIHNNVDAFITGARCLQQSYFNHYPECQFPPFWDYSFQNVLQFCNITAQSCQMIFTPRPIINTAVVLTNTSIMLIGGILSNTQLNYINVYDIHSQSWSIVSIEVNREGPGAIVFGTSLLIAGGLFSATTLTSVLRCPLTDTYPFQCLTLDNGLLVPRYMPSLYQHQGNLFVVGGSSIQNSFEIWNSSSLSPEAVYDLPCSAPQIMFLNKIMFALCSEGIYMFHMQTRLWSSTMIKYMPGIQSYSILTRDSMILSLGGEASFRQKKDVFGSKLCNSDSECMLDSIFCNGAENCLPFGLCVKWMNQCDSVEGPCSSRNPAFCNETLRKCVSPEFTPCNDNQYCNGNDMCDANGQCSIHGQNPCENYPQCQNFCNENTDSCLSPSGHSCDDNNWCNGLDQCDGGGQCSIHQGSPCATNMSLPIHGSCYTCNNNTRSCLAAQGAICNDNVFCNGADFCDGNGLCNQHSGFPCYSNATDVCAGGCEESIKQCVYPYRAPCEDNNFCNGFDLCDGKGSCSIHGGDPCFSAEDPCRPPGRCDENSRSCNFPDSSTTCDDNLYCNGNDKCDGSGGCTIHSGSPCSGLTCLSCNETAKNCLPTTISGPCGPCAVCNVSGGCTPLVSGIDCDDGIFCNGVDVCDGFGTCVHLGQACPECHLCNETHKGKCTPAPKGSPCNDLMFCNGNDTCDGVGICSVHYGNPCPQCTVCNENQAVCQASALHSPCDDDIVCNGNDLCDGNGKCSLHGGNACPKSCSCNELFKQCDNCSYECGMII